jgi:hypothetical protein
MDLSASLRRPSLQTANPHGRKIFLSIPLRTFAVGDGEIVASFHRRPTMPAPTCFGKDPGGNLYVVRWELEVVLARNPGCY